MPEQTLNIPGLIVVAVFSFFAIRWLLSSSASSNSSSNAAARGVGRRVDPNAVEQLAQMFPQLSRRDIQWDLQRSGGNVAATTERVLSGRGLETPPPSFRPQLPPSATLAQSSRSSVEQKKETTYPDLITRYNLSSRVGSHHSSSLDPSSGSISGEPVAAREQKTQGWSNDKKERALVLQKKREDMILAARRRLEQKDREKGM